MELGRVKDFYRYTSETTSSPYAKHKFCLDQLKPLLDLTVSLMEKETKSEKTPRKRSKKA